MTAGKNENIYDVIIVGAGAAGLMCAASPAWKAEESQEHLCTGAGRLVLEATGRAGVKLLMSGGGPSFAHRAPKSMPTVRKARPT
ncbi:MAG: NAD(P)/FAD-dependent oxidoreductase [Firmicutes bacterium]|nr:NAD(P)/FAD-dependent oxidoreductase [Bacillota bacterium]